MSLTGNTEVKNNLVGDIHIIKTINGYSAYEIAVQNGFEGTVEEWLKSIKGEKGEPGTMELFGELDADSKRIMNVADPEEDGDAVNLKCVKDKIKVISEPVEAVLYEAIDAGDLGTITYFDVEAEWLDFANLHNGFELTIIPNAPNGNITGLRINGGEVVGVQYPTGGDIPARKFETNFPHKLIYWKHTDESGTVFDAWLSCFVTKTKTSELENDAPLPIEKGGTGATTAEEVREILSLYSQRQANDRFMKLATDITGENIDKVTNQGFYFGGNVENSPFNYVFLEVEKCKGYIFQRAIDVQSGTIALRRVVAAPPGFTGVEWEYENPPMELDVEYATTERYDGKVVYTKRIKTPELTFPEQDGDAYFMDVGLSIGGSADVFSFECYFVEVGTHKRVKAPLTKSGEIFAEVYVYPAAFRVSTIKNAGNYEKYITEITAKYTKE